MLDRRISALEGTKARAFAELTIATGAGSALRKGAAALTAYVRHLAAVFRGGRSPLALLFATMEAPALCATEPDGPTQSGFICERRAAFSADPTARRLVGLRRGLNAE